MKKKLDKFLKPSGKHVTAAAQIIACAIFERTTIMVML